MKILCISDQIDPLVYTNSIRERFGDVDIVLSAGDLPMDYLDFVVSSLNKPLFFVFGNHNLNVLAYYTGGACVNYAEEHSYQGSGAIHVGSKIARHEGLIIAGLGGSRRYNRGENQFTESQMMRQILKLIPALLFNRVFRGRYVDILLTHASPRGIHDREDRCHMGFKAFLWFMRTFKPKYLVHGHIHLYSLSDVRVTNYGETTVVNAFSHYVIDTKGDDTKDGDAFASPRASRRARKRK
ncbi:MAG: metallophosphoesterase [Treponema sp.]|jgi:Icc-related predicted phosphoesterase|nr:metallophosphoesterase [Treponema sp.]